MTLLPRQEEGQTVKPNTYRTVIFEGNESTGKTTLMRAFQKATNWGYPCIDRWLVSALVYNTYKQRNVDQVAEIYLEIDDLIKNHGVLIVYLKVDTEVQKKRFSKRGDWLYTERDLSQIEVFYHAVMEGLIRRYPNNVLVLTNNDGDEERNIIEITTRLLELRQWSDMIKGGRNGGK